jgi:hypothetical protein
VAAAISAGIGGADLATVQAMAGNPRRPGIGLALLGAALGRRAFTAQQSLSVMACRPDVALGVARPLPDTLWPDDAIDLAEALLLRRKPC